MDKESQIKAEPAKSTVNTTTTTAVNPSHQANGTPKTPPALTTVTTFHNQPTPTNRKVVQVNLSGDRLAPSFSPSERLSQASSSQQTPKTVSLAAGSTPLVRGSHNPIAATATRKISPQALLLGKSPNPSQAQMLLRAQMLILTSAVRPDVPALSSSSSFSSSSSTPSSSSPRFPSTQLQSLTLRPPLPGTLTIPPNLPLKPTTSNQPPPLSCPRLPTFLLRPSQPANAPGKDGATKTESPTAQTKATPVRHLTVPPPSLYAPAQAHALAKQKLNSSGLKRPHSQISIPQHPFNQRHTPPNSPPATPKKPLPELKRCPSTQPSQSMSAQSASVPITVPSPARSHLTPPTLTLPLRSSSPGGSLLATKQLLRIALSSASAQCTNGQSKTATVSPPHDLIQSKPLVLPVLSKPECPAQPLRTTNPCPQLVQLSPSRQTTAATPLIPTPPLASPQRASPPSPVLPLVSTSSILAPPQSPLTSQSPTQTAQSLKDSKDRKEEQKEKDVLDQSPQDLKCPAPQKKIPQAVAVDQPSSETSEKVLSKMTVCTEDSRTDSQMKTSQKNETLSPSVAPWPAEKDEQCEEMSTQSDNHSAISSLSSDMSPIQSSMTQPLDMSPVDSCFPPRFLPVLDRPPVQPPTVSQMIPTEVQQPSGAPKPLVLTHLVEGFIIQEGLEPFPVSRSSLMVGPVQESGVNGVREAELIPSSSEPPEDSTDSDDEDLVTNNGIVRAHKLVLQCQFCKRKGTAQTFPRSKRFCSKSCAKRFSYTKRFRALRRCVSEGGHRSELNGAEENFHQAKHGTTEQWRILQQPPHEGEDGTAAPMKTRLRRHTEQERERETRVRQTVEETRSAPTSPIDPVSPTDVSPYPKPAQWSVDQVSSFISNLPGCQDIAESFRAQEIDGQALLLLTEDHLMSALNIKLGPALKICARINSLKEGGR
ncbi:polyhomeotic-like protein 3 isoform X1 [Rhinichthys klamathensis goyatoka]|uniref:polyhomeotic-like protein 3 isoform X1 n=1 Tax=Rhinichthys klamathensis goyatoka TaxID=3034132 RepID=UPI0024B50F69|nr:polyhomeotic-like protein 3 isoform X1 [Rhinichthys klamathensis goyatoka]XP_056105096.1 polyhomeotic-like protein 3 isoform X1 [Rhinichthys klamathensis goyatoka]XP_056105097.1 polyhomeotic-like protein 3 isoform X1 [Rhinichthys klamathensis goyatoka]